MKRPFSFEASNLKRQDFGGIRGCGVVGAPSGGANGLAKLVIVL